MRRDEHLRAQPPKKPVQAMRRGEHLRAQPPKKQVQAMRRGEHLRAQPPKKQVQAMWRSEDVRLFESCCWLPVLTQVRFSYHHTVAAVSILNIDDFGCWAFPFLVLMCSTHCTGEA